VAAPDGRLVRYEAQTDAPLLVLSVCFIAVYSLQVAAPGLPAGLRVLIEVTSWAIWAASAVDLAIRVWLSERRLRADSPGRRARCAAAGATSVAGAARVHAGQALVTRGGRFSVLRSTQAVAIAAAILVLIVALSMLDAERDDPGAHCNV